LPSHPLTNYDIDRYCRNIATYRGTFMMDELKIATSDECLVVNYAKSIHKGTHWICLWIKDNKCIIFNSYGAPPPLEILEYTKSCTKRQYSTDPIQTYTEGICGHYCVYVLQELNKGRDMNDILDELYNYHH
jgi:hypothetical protein